MSVELLVWLSLILFFRVSTEQPSLVTPIGSFLSGARLSEPPDPKQTLAVTEGTFISLG